VPEIYLDLNRERIRTVLEEAYKVSEDILGVTFNISKQEFVSKIEPFLASNRVSIPVQLSLPCRLYPNMIIELDMRRQKVIARNLNKKPRILLNRYITKL